MYEWTKFGCTRTHRDCLVCAYVWPIQNFRRVSKQAEKRLPPKHRAESNLTINALTDQTHTSDEPSRRPRPVFLKLSSKVFLQDVVQQSNAVLRTSLKVERTLITRRKKVENPVKREGDGDKAGKLENSDCCRPGRFKLLLGHYRHKRAICW